VEIPVIYQKMCHLNRKELKIHVAIIMTTIYNLGVTEYEHFK